MDILEALQQINEGKCFYRKLRYPIQENCSKVYQQAGRMGVSVNVEPSKPRTCTHQRNRPNGEAETTEEWYRVNVAVSFLDHIISELDYKFSAVAQTSSHLLGLVPSILCFQSQVDISKTAIVS